MEKSDKRCSLPRIGKDEGIQLGNSLFDVTIKKNGKWSDKRDNLLVKWLVKEGFLYVREDWDRIDCELCNVNETRTHITNDCLCVED